MSWHYSLALGEAFLEACSSDGAPSAPWSSTPTALDDSCSDAGNRPPKVHFVVTDGNAMGASPPGVKIVCELDENGRSHARLSDMRVGHEGEHIANVIVTPAWATR